MPPVASWKASYSVGDSVMDGQHRKLLDICDVIASLIADDSHAGVREFHAVLKGLAAYATSHFRTEEELLRHYDYPLLDEETAGHVIYETRLSRFLFAAIDRRVAKAQLPPFLAAWWVDHILNSDMHFSAYLRASR